MAKILLIEPFYTGSHRSWALELQKYSQHEIQLLTLPGKFWKWRMQVGAIELAKQYQKLNFDPDLILANDLLDLPTFLSLTRKETASIPVVSYFHENQLTYPWSGYEKKDLNQKIKSLGLINLKTALASQKVFFNSEYHRKSFLLACAELFDQAPEQNETNIIKEIEEKSFVLPIGMEFQQSDQFQVQKETIPTFVWNHRHESDKNPMRFFQTLYQLQEKQIAFQLVVLGESPEIPSSLFLEAKEKLKDHILHWGHCDSKEEYFQWLWRGNILLNTSFHDFFGISTLEAIYCECFPVLPERLAYPEHIQGADYFYQNASEILPKLIKLIESKAYLKPQCKSQILKYNWRDLIEKYDRLLLP